MMFIAGWDSPPYLHGGFFRISEGFLVLALTWIFFYHPKWASQPPKHNLYER